MIRDNSDKRPLIRSKGLYLSILWSVLTTAVFGSVTGIISLTDKNGVPQPNFPSGANVYIQVDDADRNLDTSKVETITVLFSTETEPDGEIITLYETEDNSGLFMGKGSLKNESAFRGDGILQAVQGDRITAIYVDPEDEFGE